jgi:hypothetical protein
VLVGMIYSMTIAMHYFSTGNGSTITHDRILGDLCVPKT